MGQESSSNEMAEILRAWDDEEDEVVDFMRTSKTNRGNLSSASSQSTNGSTTVAKYSPSSIRVAKTMCLFVSFFGLVSRICIEPTMYIEMFCYRLYYYLV